MNCERRVLGTLCAVDEDVMREGVVENCDRNMSRCQGRHVRKCTPPWQNVHIVRILVEHYVTSVLSLTTTEGVPAIYCMLDSMLPTRYLHLLLILF